MTTKHNSSGGGSITIAPPVTAGNYTLTLPAATDTVATQSQLTGGFKNKIINGAMDVWQRGTSFTPSLGVETYTADRWFVYCTGAAATFVRSSGTENFRYCLAFNGVASNTEVSIAHRVESLNAYSFVGQSAITLRTRIFANVAKSITYLIQTANTQDTFSARTTRQTATLSHAGGGWQTFDITYASPHADVANGISIQYNFGACASGTFGITGVQWEIGSVATPFEHRPYGAELALCQRYYYRGGRGWFGTANLTTNILLSGTFPVPLRSAPTAFGGLAGLGGSAIVRGGGAAETINSYAWAAAGMNGGYLYVAGTGYTANAPYSLVVDLIEASAEL